VRDAWPDVDVRGKVALVTGGGTRVGRVLAETLGRHGATMAVHYNDSDAGAEEVVAALAKSGGRGKTFGADLSDAMECAKLIDGVVAAFGGLDILVNSAAIMMKTPFGSVSIEQWDRMFAINLRAPFFLSQAAAPHLKKSKGAIVNIADLAGFETWSIYVPHGLTKGGVVKMTRGLANVLSPHVRVNAIAPGNVLPPVGMKSAEIEKLNDTTPLKRWGSPEDVAKAMMFLIESDYVTGETVVVDGGRHVRVATTE
jgi:pteridine reductase